jgi:hypothetical protein
MHDGRSCRLRSRASGLPLQSLFLFAVIAFSF